MGAVDQAQVLVPTQSVFAIEPPPMPFPLCSFKESPLPSFLEYESLQWSYFFFFSQLSAACLRWFWADSEVCLWSHFSFQPTTYGDTCLTSTRVIHEMVNFLSYDPTRRLVCHLGEIIRDPYKISACADTIILCLEAFINSHKHYLS